MTAAEALTCTTHQQVHGVLGPSWGQGGARGNRAAGASAARGEPAGSCWQSSRRGKFRLGAEQVGKKSCAPLDEIKMHEKLFKRFFVELPKSEAMLSVT